MDLLLFTNGLVLDQSLGSNIKLQYKGAVIIYGLGPVEKRGQKNFSASKIESLFQGIPAAKSPTHLRP